MPGIATAEKLHNVNPEQLQFTKLPHAVFALMAVLTGAQWKLLCALIHLTLGITRQKTGELHTAPLVPKRRQ